MPVFNIPLPHSRGYQSNEWKCVQKNPSVCCGDDGSFITSMILNILHARVTASNGTTHEFETVYDPDTGVLDIDIPSCYLDFMESIQIGPNIKRYLQWLIGSVCSDCLIWVTEEDLTAIDATTYRTPHPFYIDSLAVFVNGIRIEQTNDDGFDILDNETFRLKQTYPADFRISAGYMRSN